jgi:hypothetical protein
MGGWVRPTGAAAVGRQDIISDTSQFTIFISAPDAGIRYWGMTHGDPNVNDNDVIVVSDSAVNFNAWAHVSQVSYSGDAVLYVNGMAVTHTTNNSDTTPEDDANNNYNFVFGAGVDKVSNFYAGEVDDWEFSVFGNNTGNAGPPLGQNWGNIDLAVDNDFIRQALIGKPLGDVNRNGVTDAADLTLFKLNWLSEKTINGFRVGDLSTRDVGDLNIDGIVNLADAVILRNGLIAAGSGAAFDLGDLVPEPGSMFLAVFGLMSVAGMRRRRG